MKIQPNAFALILSASLLRLGYAGAILPPPISSNSSITSGAPDVEVMGSYEDSVVVYDARKGESSGSGINVITLRSSYGTWTVSYDFGYGNYLMLGSGNLEKKYINVRFDGGRPANLKSAYGSGSCRVNSASRN